jgi:DNA-binding response OmpR family regulator
VTNLSLYIHYLREKLEDDPEHPVYIRSEWGSGYWFSVQNEEPI